MSRNHISVNSDPVHCSPHESIFWLAHFKSHIYFSYSGYFRFSPLYQQSGITSKETWEMRAWLSDVTTLTHGWHNGCCMVLTGGPSKFSGIIYKVTDSSSAEHCSVCTCMLARRRKDAKHWKAAVNMPHALSNTHLMYNHLGSLKKKNVTCWSWGEL